MKYRYDVYRQDHQIFYDKTTVEWIKAHTGPPLDADLTVRGGEHLRLGPDWEVEVLAVPGHAKGHIAIYDSQHHALYGGDAIHGSVYLGLDGTAKLCPTYTDIDDYLATIQLIEHLPIETYVGCHWPIKRNGEIENFCKESRDFVEKADALVLSLLQQPHSLREICQQLCTQLGEWPRTVDLELVYALEGHVRRWVQRGKLRSKVRCANPRVLEFVLS
jgi:glyoxylase-like metal-dependent hydrolase (beta-lactamase superfamily II)